MGFLRDTKSTCGAVAAVLLALAFCAGAATLTPDLAVLRMIRQRESEFDLGSAEAMLEFEMRSEELAVLSAAYVVLGTAVKVSSGGFGAVVELCPERFLKGVESDTLVFSSAGVVSKWGSIVSYEFAEYAEGERMVVLLDWLDSERGTRVLSGSPVRSKYLVDSEATVVRKSIPLERFLEELESVLATRTPANVVEASDLVVVATVSEVWSENHDVPDDRYPSGFRVQDFPHARLSVTRVLKGAGQTESITVAMPSPKSVAGRYNPRFREDEEVLVFLRSRSDGLFDLVGGRDGKHRMSDPTTYAVLVQSGFIWESKRMYLNSRRRPPN